MKLISIHILFFIVAVSTLTFSQINTEKYRNSNDSTGFSTSVDVDFSANTGNVDFQQFGAGGRLNYNWGESYTFLVFKGALGWTNGKQYSNDALVHLRNVNTLNEVLQLELFTQLDYNKKRLLNVRELIGAGLRYKIFSDEFMKFRLALAYMYEIEKYDLQINSIHPANRYANRMSSYITFEIKIQENLGITSITYYQPEISMFDDYRVLSDNSLSVALGKVIDLNINFSLRFDSNPPDNIEDLDTATKVGITFNF